MSAVEEIGGQLVANRLHEHEAAIERSLSELGWHLRAIRDERLYRLEHATFEDYCRQRWNYSRQYVNKQIAAAEIIDALPVETIVSTPTEFTVRPLSLLPPPERAEAWREAVDRSAGAPTARVVAEVDAERRVPLIVPTGGKGHDGPPHPATYPAAVLDVFRSLIPAGSFVLDPFAGIGTIHELRPHCRTAGVELEAEWAGVHDDTICGDSRDLSMFDAGQFDVIATSPAYGNRLADAFYNAHDAEGRRTYAFDLGRPLTEGNGAGLHFDTDGRYEILHRAVWAECARVLRDGGLFLLNCKDFTRERAVIPVIGWHIGALVALGFEVIDLRTLPAAGLPYTTAKPLSEVVVVLRGAAS